MGSSPALDQIFFVQIFFRLCETFFRNFFKCLRALDMAPTWAVPGLFLIPFALTSII